MTFDSLGGNHQVAIEALREYLRAEALDKGHTPIENKLPVRGKMVPVRAIPFFLRNTFNSRFPFPDSGTTKFLRLWRVCWTSGPNHIPVSCRVLAARLCKLHFLRQHRAVINSPQSRRQKNRLTGNHPLWDVERFKKKRNELYNLITTLSKQWKEVRGKTAPAPLLDSSTLPASEAAKDDKVTPLLMSTKRKSRSMEPVGGPDEDEVIILDGPAAKRKQGSPRKKAGSTPRKSTGGATRSRRYS